MKGTNPTKADKAYWSKLIEVVGCIACRLDGNPNHHATIHHCDGRTKPGAHGRVIPLCFQHHQGGGTDPPSVHPYKARFEARYGTQEELAKQCADAILGHGQT